jgi:Tol biopolymer transport system component
MVPTVKNNVEQVFQYNSRDLTFSSDGRKVAICTDHKHGSALVFILAKDEQNIWESWGSYQLVTRKLDNWDDNCFGFTGLSLYHHK